ncbi:MAG: sigma-70 family RNA polymerase sigma factor [Planctomycetes bacterium]|nr:sigma-70 family RNA polymerase sigma factor [Planctomycetota bacterium]MCB9890495.1 sigma-70 family RNA polymerase sigma factor [Planctomycetota bacterium]MCB9917736.1 sigma-70 family RNA polymerase sigma factor [Planctomycetota bacterium]
MTDDAHWMIELDAARGGNREAMDRLIDALLPEVRAYVRLHSGRRIRERESVTDVVQTICHEIVVDLHGFKGNAEKQFRKWLFRLALAKIHDRHRFHSAQMRAAEREVRLASHTATSVDGHDELLDCYATFCTPSVHMSAREEVARIENAIDRLHAEHREIIALSCFAGLSHAEIADELGKSEPAVRKLLSRARANLAVLLAKDED